jgi:hypothetical protein
MLCVVSMFLVVIIFFLHFFFPFIHIQIKMCIFVKVVCIFLSLLKTMKVVENGIFVNLYLTCEEGLRKY